jgi:F-type H+-transporting ATPase subunit gamma
MEMVAAAKMRRAQTDVLAARPYASKMEDLLAHLAAMALTDSSELHPLLQTRPVKKIAIIQITPDRGMCGGLVANINRRTGSFIVEQEVPATIVTVGNKGRDFMARTSRELRASFDGLGDRPKLIDTTAVSRIVVEDFSNGECDAAFLAYTEFVNTVVQRPVIKQLLPVEPAELSATEMSGYIYEPRQVELMGSLLPRIVEMQVFSSILESNASEQSARMMAMRNATDSANDLVKELTLQANKARQATITGELLDIIGGSMTFEN